MTAIENLVPDSGGYDDFKAAVLYLVPVLPALAQARFDEDLAALGAVNVRWRNKREHALSDGKPYWLVGGEGEWHGQDIGEFEKAVFLSGQEIYGAWVCGFSPGWMGHSGWVFNFTLCLPRL